jgi:hypothetical protein
VKAVGHDDPTVSLCPYAVYLRYKYTSLLAKTMIPHPPIFLSDIRLADIYFLLAVGYAWELLARLLLLFGCRRKPDWLLQKEGQLVVLQQEVTLKRNMGPHAFVETSKLERILLQKERELSELQTYRKQQTEALEKLILRYGNWAVSLLIFVAYYGVPVITLEGLDSVLMQNDEVMYNLGNQYVSGGTYLKALLFPISYIGFGMKLSKWGMAADQAPASLGALAVMWSAQVTCSQIMDVVDAYFA